MAATVFGVPASHPTQAARLMLDHKGIEYKRIDFAPGLHRVLLRLVGFRGRTVPALKHDGRRVQGTREIARYLDQIQPDPPLFPADPERRAEVERAETWGDEVLQPVARRVAWAVLKRDRSTLRSYLAGARMGMPHSVAAATATPLVFLSARLNAASDDAIRTDLAALPGMLDQVDNWIKQGVLDGAERNAADFQIATSVRLLGSFEDARPFLAGRPAEAHAQRIIPEYAAHAPAALPRQLLPAT